MNEYQSKGQRHYAKKEQPQFPAFETLPDETDNKKDTATSQNEKDGLTNMLSKIYNLLFEGRAAAWTAIFACASVVFSGLLWKVSKDANDTNVATQAASVSSVGPGIGKTPNPDGKSLKGYNVTFTWVNSGNTPTRGASLQSNVYIGTETPTKGLDFGQLPQARIVSAVIAPKSAIQTSPGFVSLQDLEDVQDGKKHMFFWGWAVYRDQFSATPRLSEYCFDVEGATWTKADHADLAGDTEFLNSPCGVHFCFNEECEDYASRTK